MNNKVLFVLFLPPPYGGGEIVSEYLYNQLKNKYVFIIFKRRTHNKSKQGKILFVNILFGIYYVIKVSFNSIIYKSKYVYIGLSKSKLPFLRDIILILILRLLGKRIISELHGMNFGFENSKLFKKILNFSFTQIIAIRVLSESIKTHLINLGFKNKIYIIDNGIPLLNSTKIKTSYKNNDKINLLYIGTISSDKGIVITLELIKYLIENTNLYIKLNIIGEFENQQIKKILINEYSNLLKSENIIFHGKLFGEKKWEILEKTFIHLHFSKWDGQPLTIIEMMSIGIPTISTKVGAIPEMIKDGYNGFLVEKDNIAFDDIYKIINTLYKNPDYYNKIASNCKEIYFKRFTDKIMCDKINNMINEITLI